MVSPDFCNSVPYVGLNSIVVDGTHYFNFLFSGGFNVAYQLNKSLALETGLLYSQKGQKFILNSRAWNTPQGTSNLDDYRYYVHYVYLEVPLKCNYYLNKGRFKVYSSVGITGNLFLGKKTIRIDPYSKKNYDKNWSYDLQNIPLVEFGLSSGIGIRYDFAPDAFFKFEPTYKQFVRPLVDLPVNGYMYSLGANFGLYFKI